VKTAAVDFIEANGRQLKAPQSFKIANSDSNVPGERQNLLDPADVCENYLRSALAYMLISMPTCTSTIFGVFQAI